MASERMLARKEKRREEIEDAAFALFCERGVKKTSVDDIAIKSNIAKGTFYLYFDNKQGLIDHLVVREANKVITEALTKLKNTSSPDQSLDEKVTIIISEIIDYFAENSQFLEFIHKNLYRGLFKEENVEQFLQLLKNFSALEKKIDTKDFQQKLYLILEMTGSVLYNAMIIKSPYQIDEIKPKLFAAVGAIINI